MSTQTATTTALPTDTRLHLIGVGGAGMSALAWILLARGHTVTGSDLRASRAVGALQAMGATIHIGHDEAHVTGADLVVVSTAVPSDSPEVVAAQRDGITVLHRSEMLALLAHGTDERIFRQVFIAGTHGKTTTTAMVTVALQAVGADPSFALGGVIGSSGAAAHHGSGELFIAEADESDGSFLAFHPDCAVITNLELDHHEYWTSLEALQESFVAFLGQRKPGGLALLCADDAGSFGLRDMVEEPVWTYGTHPEADIRIADIRTGVEGTAFTLTHHGDDLGSFAVGVPGQHNVLNAVAAIGIARWAGVDLGAVGPALEEFDGTQRRFQKIGHVNGITVIDDYAHHPTEISATLDAARQAAPHGRIIAVFQPHRYSRTNALGTELGQALAAADKVIVTEVYAAGEAPVPGATGALVADAAKAAGATACLVAGGEDLAADLADEARPGDLIITLGAGDITEVGPMLVHHLEGTHG